MVLLKTVDDADLFTQAQNIYHQKTVFKIKANKEQMAKRMQPLESITKREWSIVADDQRQLSVSPSPIIGTFNSMLNLGTGQYKEVSKPAATKYGTMYGFRNSSLPENVGFNISNHASSVKMPQFIQSSSSLQHGSSEDRSNARAKDLQKIRKIQQLSSRRVIKGSSVLNKTNSRTTYISQQRKTLAELNHKGRNAANQKKYHFQKLQLMQESLGIRRIKMGKTQTAVSSMPSTRRNISQAEYLAELHKTNKEKIPFQSQMQQHQKSRSIGLPNLSVNTNSQYVRPLNNMTHAGQFNSGVVCIGQHITQSQVDFVPPVVSPSPKISNAAKTVATQPAQNLTNASVQKSI